MDQHRSDLRLDPVEVAGAKEKDLHPRIDRREAATRERRHNDADLERDLVDCEAGLDSVSHEKDRRKGKAGWGKARLACIFQGSSPERIRGD